MSFRASQVGKLWESISKHGWRDGSQQALLRWLRTQVGFTADVLGDYSYVLTEDAPPTLRASSAKELTIAWLIPEVGPGVGGLFNIFRAIHQLEQWGHRHRIYVVGDSATDAESMTNVARRDYFPITSAIEIFNGKVADSDALVASSWQTAYAARALSNTARKFYFVQDLEYLFYAPGSIAELARETYRWGFHGITGGQWIADVLNSEFKMNSSAFGFSYDRHVYSPAGKRTFPDGKKRILFYARPITPRRGFELGVLALSEIAKQLPETEFVFVGASDRGMKLPFPTVSPGILSPMELAALYRSCTAALILSFTNLSLLPLEVMACGCPVVSNRGANVEWLLNEDTTQLAAPTPEALAAAILEVLQNDSLRTLKTEAGLRFAERTDWGKEIKAIEAGFYRGLAECAVEQQHV
jgi:hypothetical protein